jgi:hypothetical protein
MYFSYSHFMTKSSRSRTNGNALSLKIGAWFEAHASGWGIVAIPITLLLLGGLAFAKAALFN